MRVTTINENTSYDVVWRKLRKYHDEQLSVSRLMRLHSVNKQQAANVRKQAQQISYSLTQALEFSRAALSAGATTKALLAYYSLTALANVEILWKGDGSTSFDRRGAEYNSHGLELVKDENLLQFRAHTKRRNGKLMGLFGLWRNKATHFPYYGLQTNQFFTDRHEGYHTLSSMEHLNNIEYPDAPLSLSDCFAHIPGLYRSVADHSIKSKLARGKISSVNRYSAEREFQDTTTSLIIHPCTADITEAVLEDFKVPPQLVPNISFLEPTRGAMISWVTSPPYSDRSITLPESFAWTADENFFLADGSYLNEFGYFYVGLYIAGMITRYHPQSWIRELRTMTHASSLVDEFVDQSLQRVPLLTLAALDEELLVYS
ncbi:YaaC family protein [Agrobacterium sp. 22094]|uniref:YaaC family protein n=1 Tax=Agrobacterium sp. 22094 TaxID=3453872 RepID=UPI003F8334F5